MTAAERLAGRTPGHGLGYCGWSVSQPASQFLVPCRSNLSEHRLSTYAPAAAVVVRIASSIRFVRQLPSIGPPSNFTRLSSNTIHQNWESCRRKICSRNVSKSGRVASHAASTTPSGVCRVCRVIMSKRTDSLEPACICYDVAAGMTTSAGAPVVVDNSAFSTARENSKSQPKGQVIEPQLKVPKK